MKIDQLIDRDFQTVSIMEKARQVEERLFGKDYLAVTDESRRVIGVVTRFDLEDAGPYQLIDCDFGKPTISPNHTVDQAIGIMRSARTNCLPVYESGNFVGVLTSKTVKNLQVN